MNDTKRIELVVKLPLDFTAEQKQKIAALIACEILEKPNPNLLVEEKMTFAPEICEDGSFIELKTFMTLNIQNERLIDLVIKINDWLK